MITEVKTKYGMLRGVTSNGGHALFKGIRYAKAPVGRLRFAPPEEPDCSEETILCDSFGAASPQAPFDLHDETGKLKKLMPGYPYPPRMDEDCLFLNVYTPANDPSEKLPVMFYIHGGGLQTWYGSCYEYCGDGLCDHGAVVVTVNYRLNVFGFFAHPDLSKESGHNASGNYGIMDMIAALNWVRENISGFGGDPDNIMIFGQSGGGRAVQALSCSPLTKGMFRHASMQSCGGIAPFGAFEGNNTTEKLGEEFLEFAGCKTTEELRAMPWQILEQHNLEFIRFRKKTFNLDRDGYVLPDFIENCARNGSFHKIDYMIGCTIDEGHLGEGRMPLFDRMCPSARALAKMLAASGNPVYFYCFDRPQPGDDIGTPHSCDNRYIFRSLDESWRPYEDKDYKLSEIMMSYWSNFARTGNPNSENLTEWKKFERDHLEMHLAADGCKMDDFDKDGKMTERERSIIAEYFGDCTAISTGTAGTEPYKIK